MAILTKHDLPLILKVDSNEIKKYVWSMLGYPVVQVEITEDQFETVLRTAGDFIAHYFHHEMKVSYFYTKSNISEYNFPQDAYWIKEVWWDAATSNVNDIFSADSYLFNVGNIVSPQTILTDYVMLQQYRRFSRKILGTEGHWEILGDKIKLLPVPKGTYPVVIVYIPSISSFNTPHARRLTMDMAVAECKIILGNIRGKYGSMPGPDGAVTMDGDAIRTQGLEEKKNIIDEAIKLSEPLVVYKF